MTKINCTISKIERINESGRSVCSVMATCPDCMEKSYAFGTHEKSKTRCLCNLKEVCECDDRDDRYFIEDTY